MGSLGGRADANSLLHLALVSAVAQKERKKSITYIHLQDKWLANCSKESTAIATSTKSSS